MARQRELAGMETPTGDVELDAFAEAFKRSSKKRKAAQDAEIDARSVLIDAMKKKKITVYEDRRVDPPLKVTLLAGPEKVKVVAIEEGAEIDDDDEDGDESDGAAAAADAGEQKASKKRAEA